MKMGKYIINKLKKNDYVSNKLSDMILIIGLVNKTAPLLWRGILKPINKLKSIIKVTFEI